MTASCPCGASPSVGERPPRRSRQPGERHRPHRQNQGFEGQRHDRPLDGKGEHEHA